MPNREQTLAEYLVEKVGLRKASAVASFVVAWGIYLERTEAPYTLDRYSAYWKQSPAKTYRERDFFRICFPEDKVPTRVWSQCREIYSGKLDQSKREMGAAHLFSLRGAWG